MILNKLNDNIRGIYDLDKAQSLVNIIKLI